jgi:type IV pilus assembly protein PilA
MTDVRRSSEVDRGSEGFTLVEMALVILIIGILLAISLPIFLGVKAKAQHRIAQNSLHTAETEVNLLYEEGSTYDLSETRLTETEPTLTFRKSTLGGVTASHGAFDIVYWGDATSYGAVSLSRSGRCYLVTDYKGERFESYWRSAETLPCILPVSVAVPGAEWIRVR